ncbi:hypothetical protein T492DRAFT_854571 [Pavlovales sp. CCMP2436]|nr:hypothetical protein T492DRAFT_854571 [Pavlovales sp. CCMP2436]
MTRQLLLRELAELIMALSVAFVPEPAPRRQATRARKRVLLSDDVLRRMPRLKLQVDDDEEPASHHLGVPRKVAAQSVRGLAAGDCKHARPVSPGQAVIGLTGYHASHSNGASRASEHASTIFVIFG